MTQTEALKLALEALEFHTEMTRPIFETQEAIIAIKEALAQEKALQALHDENERLGLYKDAYAKPEEEKLHPVHIGVDVTREGTAVTAFYRKPDAVMEMFYSQFHPLAQPEQEPVAWMLEGWGPDCGPYFEIYRDDEMGWRDKKEWTPLYTTPPQRTEQEQQIETLKRCLFQMQEAAKDLVEQAKSLPPPQRKPLTDEEIGAILEGVNAYGTRLYTFARAIEAKLKDKNT